MSMIFNLMQVPDETIHSLLHDPSRITEFVTLQPSEAGFGAGSGGSWL